MRRYTLLGFPLTSLFIALSVLLVLVACGDGDGDESDTAAVEPTATTSSVEFIPEMMYRIQLVDDGTVDSVAYHPDSETIAAGAFMEIFVLQAEDGTEIRVLETDHSVANLEFSPDGEILAAGLSVYGVQLVDHEGVGDPLQLHGGYDNYLGFHPDGVQIATANRNGPLWIWDVDTGEQVDEFVPPIEEYALSVAYSPDGALVALGNWDGDIFLFDTEDGSLTQTFENPGDYGYARDLAFSPNGELLAVAGAQAEFTPALRIWDVEGGTEHAVFEADSQTRAVTWSPNGSQIAFGHDDGVTLIGADSLEVMTEIEFDLEAGASGWNTGLAYSPDSTMLFLSRWDGYVEMWHVQE